MTEYITLSSDDRYYDTVDALMANKILNGSILAPHTSIDTHLYELFIRNVYRLRSTLATSAVAGEYDQEHDSLKKAILARLNPQIKELNAWVDSASLPNKWLLEGVQPPTPECRKSARALVVRLLKDYQLYPSRISATVEEGVFINYMNHINKCNLSIEVYNDLAVAAIITRNKEIIKSADIPDDEAFQKIIRIFNAK